MSTDNIVDSLGYALGVLGFALAFTQYRQASLHKRAEFLENLIAEFNSPKTFIAKRILDDFWMEVEIAQEMPDDVLVQMGSSQPVEEETLSNRVKDVLRHHSEKPVVLPGEHRMRQSFDELLDFFTKLEYYYHLKMISKKELRYFQYYIERSAYKAEGAVMKYARSYGYISLLRLIYTLGITPSDKVWFLQNLVFTDNDQKKAYSE